MASTARIDELKKKFDENPRRYFAPLANEFRKVGEIEQAIMICEEFLPQQPGHMSGHIVYGQALFEAARLDEARTVFETALTLDPENLIALRHLGDIAKSQGDLDSARRWYDRVLEADPRNDEIQALIASLDETPAAVAPAETAPEPVSAPVAEEQRFAPPAIPERPAPTPPPLPEPIELDIVGDVSTAMPTTIPVQPTARPDASVGTAEGLESVEFAPPPAGSTDRAPRRARGDEPWRLRADPRWRSAPADAGHLGAIHAPSHAASGGGDPGRRAVDARVQRADRRRACRGAGTCGDVDDAGARAGG